jgi:PAS domain S-box-containing protein
MRDEDKTKEQLIRELVEKRQRIAELERSGVEREWIEEALRESEARYRALFDRTLYCVYVHDFEGRFLDVNDAALNLLGYKRDEILSLHLSSLLDEDQLRRAFKVIEVIMRTGQEGYVEDITWKTARIRMLPNNMVVIPNSKLAQSIVTNYYLPGKSMSLLIPISVSYRCDPEKIEQVLVNEAKKAIGAVPDLLGDPEPSVRFVPGFGESSLDFTLTCHIEDGIEIPFPHRTVYLKKEENG